MSKREDVIVLCDQAICNSKNIINGKDKHEIIKRIAESLESRAEEIKKICLVEKYDLYFNGTCGVGKSTAICNLFNLIDPKKIKKDESINNISLLKTAGGRTTLCETVFMQIENGPSKIVITPVVEEEFKLRVEEYCKSIVNVQARKNSNSLESVRAIENMLGIPDDFEEDDSKIRYIEDTFFMKDEKQLNIGIEKMLKKINYSERKKLEYARDDNFIDWLKNTYTKINDGLLSTCPLPQKICIYLNKQDVDMELPNYINSIIDTRGIDGGERKDIQDAIKDIKSISLMCDEIVSFGGDEGTLKILKQVLVAENNDIKNRTFLIGLDKNCDLETANKANGDRERGKRVKIKEALSKLNNDSINFSEKNIYFYDSFYGIEHSKRKIVSANNTDYLNEKNNFLEFLKQSIQRMYSIYQEEILSILTKLTVLEKNTVKDEILSKFTQCQDLVLSEKEKISSYSTNYIEKISKEITTVNAGKLRGSVNRNGEYSNFNYYEVSQKIGGEEFQEKCFEAKSHMLGAIEGIFINDDDEIEEICLACILSKIDREYYFYYENSRTLYYNESINRINHSSVWSLPRSFWGDGIGNFRGRVAQELSKSCIASGLKKYLLQIDCVENFFNEILAFLRF